MMQCTNQEYSVNERPGRESRNETDYQTKRLNQEEVSSSIGFFEELNGAVAARQRERPAWNYGSATVDREAISPISII